ncbi:hypothetical protein OBBRIDRAFT_798211 [Obba rivulosa]|uniref:Uncharacterized protein n=1 Tax=Obba rivulosa TaxID=1052685 RepID=A0A8E2DFY9_9APHY|nr:hypothetical protein OBBRIDRAFT_798211 [Obba rivulosa]
MPSANPKVGPSTQYTRLTLSLRNSVHSTLSGSDVFADAMLNLRVALLIVCQIVEFLLTAMAQHRPADQHTQMQ